jgi:hypothetical protein
VEQVQGNFEGLGRTLAGLGVVLLVLGGLLMAGGRMGLGRLPGDLSWEGPGWTVRFPIVTCIVVSVILTVILQVLTRLRGP